MSFEGNLARKINEGEQKDASGRKIPAEIRKATDNQKRGMEVKNDNVIHFPGAKKENQPTNDNKKQNTEIDKDEISYRYFVKGSFEEMQIRAGLEGLMNDTGLSWEVFQNNEKPIPKEALRKFANEYLRIMMSTRGKSMDEAKGCRKRFEEFINNPVSYEQKLKNEEQLENEQKFRKAA